MFKKKTGLSLGQILAGAGSAVTAAYVGTKLGVSGTIIGAAVGSVTGTLATHIYSNSLAQGREALKKAQDVALLSVLNKGGITSSGVSLPDSESSIEENTSISTTPHGTVVSNDVIHQLIAQDLEELERNARRPWYKTTALRQVVASSGVAMATALGLIYALGGMPGNEAESLTGGVSINSITVETHEPAPEPTIIYMPSPSQEETDGQGVTIPNEEPTEEPTTPSEGLGEPPRVPVPTKPTNEPTTPPKPVPTTPKPSAEPTPVETTPAPASPTPSPTPSPEEMGTTNTTPSGSPLQEKNSLTPTSSLTTSE